MSSCQCKLTGKALKIRQLFSLEMDEIFTKGDLQFPKLYRMAENENMKHFVSPTSNLAPKMVVLLPSPGNTAVK